MRTTGASGETIVSLARDIEQGFRDAQAHDTPLGDDAGPARPFAPMTVVTLALLALAAGGSIMALGAAAIVLALGRGAA